MLYSKRWKILKKIQQEQGLKALILTPGAGMRYLTGFSEEGYERLLALVVPNNDIQPFFIVPKLYENQVRANLAGIVNIELWDDADGWQDLFKNVMTGSLREASMLGIDDNMPARFALPIAQIFPNCTLVLAGPMLTKLRSVKDSSEQKHMLDAGKMSDSLLVTIYENCQVGRTELEISQLILQTITKDGHEASFSPIIGTGPNGANPHHHTENTKLQHKDVVILDFGAKVDGYCGDITRTVAIGAASDEAKKVYRVVFQAHQAAVNAVHHGATGHSIDAAARQVITQAGYGEYFVHRTGHGIGLDDHEPPYIVEGNHTPIQPGECFSIEPGIYLPGKFGVRLENIFMMQKDGMAYCFNEDIPSEIMII